MAENDKPENEPVAEVADTFSIEEGVSSLSEDEVAAVRRADEEHRAKAEAGEPVQEVDPAPEDKKAEGQDE